MSHPLADFRIKLNRANQHLESLKREVDAWFEKHPYGVSGKYDPGPPEKYILYLRFFEPPPHDWGVIIGDFAHNARSALDYLAWKLVQANGNAPDRRTQFPIVLSPWDWHGRNGIERLRGASGRHIEMVEQFQPYNRRDSDGASYDRICFFHPLAILSNLNNEDKHRVLVSTEMALNSIGWGVVGVQDVAPVTDVGKARVGGPLIDGSPLIEMPVVATGPNPQVEVEFTERAHIAMTYVVEVNTGIAWAMNIDVVNQLENITAELRRVFQVFIREFV